jgi:hypothetical protein
MADARSSLDRCTDSETPKTEENGWWHIDGKVGDTPVGVCAYQERNGSRRMATPTKAVPAH